jgi:hypothetical protein
MSSHHPKPPAAPPLLPTPAFVDAIESGIARLLIQTADGEWRGYGLPSQLLPAEAKEGSWLRLRLELGPAPVDAENLPLRRRLGAADDGKDFSL